MNYVK